MILEGLVTTLNADESTHIAPMGPVVDRQITQLCLRPYTTSQTWRNLQRHGEGVFHVTDDVELLARAAVGRIERLPPLVPAAAVRGQILADACRWYAFRVDELDERSPRAAWTARSSIAGRFAISSASTEPSTRWSKPPSWRRGVHLLPRQQILQQMQQLRQWVDKTGGDQEHRAFEFLWQYVQNVDAAPPELSR